MMFRTNKLNLGLVEYENVYIATKPNNESYLSFSIKNTGHTPIPINTSHGLAVILKNAKSSQFQHSSWINNVIAANKFNLRPKIFTKNNNNKILPPGRIADFNIHIQTPNNIKPGWYREDFSLILHGQKFIFDEVQIPFEIEIVKPIPQDK